MHAFTPIPDLIGGLLIGLSAAGLLLFRGKIAGISGILSGLLNPVRHDMEWRLLFLVGLVAGGLAVSAFTPGAFAMGLDRSISVLALAGLLVGGGARLGSGCTSGHGVCGVSRLSPRSLVATLIFIGTGAATVFFINRLFGGAL